MLFLSILGGSLLVGLAAVVLVTTAASVASLAVVPVTVAVVVAGVVALVAGRLVERPLPGGDVDQVLAAHRTRLLVRLAAAETPALVGFVGTVLTWSLVPYAAGLAVAAVGFWRAAPTGRSLAEDQRALAAAGSAVDLVATLTAARPVGPGDPGAD